MGWEDDLPGGNSKQGECHMMIDDDGINCKSPIEVEIVFIDKKGNPYTSYYCSKHIETARKRAIRSKMKIEKITHLNNRTVREE